MAKKIITLFVIAALAASLTACGAKESTPTTSDTETASQTQKAEEQNKEQNVIKAHDCEAKIINCELSKDDNGDDAITLTMEFQNDTDQPLTFNNIFYQQVFQNGIEQRADNFYPGEGYDWETYYTEIKDGARITVYHQGPIANTTDPVEVVIGSFETGEKITKTFELK